MEETRVNRTGKFRKHHAFLLAEALICLLAICWEMRPGKVFEASVTFPFAQMGAFLRALSLSGAAGNAAAILLYGVFCLIPAGYLLWRQVKKRTGREDWLLLLLSALLFAGLYLFINPALLERMTALEGMAAAGKWAVSAGIYAVLTGYVVLRLLSGFDRKKGEVTGQLAFLLKCAEAVVVFSFVFLQMAETLSGLETMREKNTGAAPKMLFLTGLVLCLGLLVRGVSSLLILLVLERGILFLEALSADRYSAQTKRQGEKICAVCRTAVFWQVFSGMGMNLLQLLLGRFLLQMDYRLYIPLTSIILLLAVMLAVRYLEEGKQLKEENDLFI